eukprot:3780992-Rhodomonas_salina.2
MRGPVFALVLLSVTAGALADLTNADYRCATECSGGNVCQSAGTATTNVGVDFQTTDYFNPNVEMNWCPLSNQPAAGVSGKVYSCDHLGWANAGINMKLPVANNPDALTFSFWVKPYMIGNNFKFLNITVRHPSKAYPSANFHEILVYRTNYQFFMSAKVDGNPVPRDVNQGTGPNIPWFNTNWYHVMVSVHNGLRPNGEPAQYVRYFVNGLQYIELETTPSALTFGSDTFVSLSQKGPGTSAGTAGVLGNSIMQISDFSVFTLPNANGDSLADLALNLYNKRYVPAYNSVSTNPNWPGFSFHSVSFPKHECGACPCDAGQTCQTTETGFMCMCGASECQQ